MGNDTEVKVNKYLFALVLEILFFKFYFRSHLSLCHASNRADIHVQHTHITLLCCKMILESAIKGKCSSTKSSRASYQNFCQNVQELLTLQITVQLCEVMCQSSVFSWVKLRSKVLVLSKPVAKCPLPEVGTWF